MEELEVRVRKSDNAKWLMTLPQYATEGSSGLDLTASIEEDIIIKPNEIKLVNTGLIIEIPVGYEGEVRPRSGLALKHGITVLNSPGTIDSDYRGEVGVILINLGKEDFVVQRGDRIAQLVIGKYERVRLKVTNSLTDTDRGENGYGHSGVK